VNAEPRFRRPTPRWCTDTAIRILQIGCRDHGALDSKTSEPLLATGEAELLVKAAAALDAYGQRLARAKTS
jgi:hypothetical protein